MTIFDTFDDPSGYFRPLLSIFDTFDDPSGYFRPILGLKYQFLLLNF
jgi:hypothetical protein